jgi:hypothetical protein
MDECGDLRPTRGVPSECDAVRLDRDKERAREGGRRLEDEVVDEVVDDVRLSGNLPVLAMLPSVRPTRGANCTMAEAVSSFRRPTLCIQMGL